MKRVKISVGAGFVLLFSALYFFDDSGLLAALIPAVVAHELGHVAAIRLMGAEVTRLRLRISGLVMDYRGNLTPQQEAIAAAAGPAAGLTFAVAASIAGKVAGSEYLLCSAGISLVFSLFNLLPAYPLDGARILNALGVYTRISAIAASVALSAAGLWFYSLGHGGALILAGVLLMVYNACQNA